MKHSQSESVKKQKREKVTVDNKNVHKTNEATSSRPLYDELFCNLVTDYCIFLIQHRIFSITLA